VILGRNPATDRPETQAGFILGKVQNRRPRQIGRNALEAILARFTELSSVLSYRAIKAG
jgi:hypothetical protein